jgi:hypothetical protein
MLSIGRVASGQAAVAYFTGGQEARAAGCTAGYYTDGTLAHQVTLGQIRQTTADSNADVADLMIIPHVLHEVRVDAAQRMDTFIRGLDRAPEPE